MPNLVGKKANMEHSVEPGDTAVAVRSGTVEVLGTPTLLAWLEEATVRAVTDELAPGSTTVGTEVSLRHLRASPVGSRVHVAAEVAAQDRSFIDFAVIATTPDGAVVAEGVVRRAIVDVERFLQRI
jgi:predicted thioesterase